MLSAAHVELEIRQQPQRAQVVQASNQKNRKPIDPPPIVELRINDVGDPYSRYWHVSPRTFMIVTLLDAKEDSDGPLEDFGKHLIGQTVSSLHRLRDGPSHGESDQDNCNIPPPQMQERKALTIFQLLLSSSLVMSRPRKWASGGCVSVCSTRSGTFQL